MEIQAKLGTDGTAGKDGVDGKGIKSITEKYAVSTSNATEPTTWYDTVQTMTSTNKYLWNYEIITYTDDTTATTNKRVIGVYGDTGNTGLRGESGKDGKGIKTTTKYYLATSIGTAGDIGPIQWDGDTTDREATENFGDEDWPSILYKVSDEILNSYEDLIGATITLASGGEEVEGNEITNEEVFNLDNGKVFGIGDPEVNSYVVLVIKESTTDFPYSTGIYFFNLSGFLYVSSLVKGEGISINTEGWTTEMQTTDEINKYLWSYEVVEYTDGTTNTIEPIIIGTHGETGIGVSAIVSEYYLSTSNTAQEEGSWSETQPEWEDGKYFWTRSKITWTDGTITYTDPVLAEGINNANQNVSIVKETVAKQEIKVDSIQQTVSTTQTIVGNNYNELKTKFDDYAPKSDVITLQTSVEKIQTDTYTKTEINTKLTDGSVTKVLTTAGTFDEDGLTIEKTNAKTKGNFNEKGIAVMDATSGSSQELLFAGYDEELNETIVRSKNMTVEKYFVECNIARREGYSNPVLGGKGIGVFML